MQTKRYEAVSALGRHIGTYTISDAMLLFKGAASFHNGKIFVDEKRCGTIDEDRGWRAIRENDGTDSYWTPDTFEQRFGIAFSLNITSMNDVEHFAKLAEKSDPDRSNKPSPLRKSQDSRKRSRVSGAKPTKSALPDGESNAGQKDRYAHFHTREIPPALGYHWKWENGNIYCVDDDDNKISESYLKSEIEVYWSDLELEKRMEARQEYRASDPSWDDDFDYPEPDVRNDDSGEFRTMQSVSRLSKKAKTKPNLNTADIRSRDDADTCKEKLGEDKYIHSRTRPIPPDLDYHWISENGNIYCVDKNGRKITELHLRAKIDMPRMRNGHGVVTTTHESSEHAELRRRNEEIMNKAMREHRNDHLKPAGWEATQRHNEEKAREKQRRANKRKREEAANRKREAAAKKKAEAETKRQAAAKAAITAPADNPSEQSGPHALVRKTTSSMTDKQCLLKALSEIPDPFVAEAVKSMFHAVGMQGIVERALMLLRGEPREDKPVSLDPSATEHVIRYHYCKTDSIRLYCFRVVAEAIARKVSDANAEGPEPYIWALENSKDKRGARKRAAMSILNDTEHLILFSDEIVRKASSCIDELTILPYPTTLVRIEGIPNTWGAVAYESSKGIEISTIGERPCEKVAQRLLAFIENHCTPQSYDGYKVNFETAESAPKEKPDHFAEPTAPLPSTIDQRTHIIKSEAERKARESRGRHHRIPESIAPHVRRGHMRRQHYGKGNSLVKNIYIAPTTVKPRGDGMVPFDQRVHVVR